MHRVYSAAMHDRIRFARKKKRRTKKKEGRRCMQARGRGTQRSSRAAGRVSVRSHLAHVLIALSGLGGASHEHEGTAGILALINKNRTTTKKKREKVRGQAWDRSRTTGQRAGRSACVPCHIVFHRPGSAWPGGRNDRERKGGGRKCCEQPRAERGQSQ